MNKHNKIEKLIIIYRELSKEDRHIVDQHTQTCPTCAALLEDYQVMDQDLSSLQKQDFAHLAYHKPDKTTFLKNIAAYDRSQIKFGQERMWLPTIPKLAGGFSTLAVLLLAAILLITIFRGINQSEIAEQSTNPATATLMVVAWMTPTPTIAKIETSIVITPTPTQESTATPTVALHTPTPIPPSPTLEPVINTPSPTITPIADVEGESLPSLDSLPAPIAQAAGGDGVTDSVDFQSLDKGSDLYDFYNIGEIALYESTLFKIETEHKLEEFWSPNNPVEMPVINFEEEMVIVLVDQGRASGGYSVEINGLAETNQSILVKATRTSPGQNCVVADAITQPYHIVRTMKSSKSLLLSATETIHDCGDSQ